VPGGQAMNSSPAARPAIRHYMRPYLRIVIGLLIIFFGYKSIRHQFGAYDVGVFSEFDYIPLGIVIILTIVILLLDRSAFKVDRKIYQFSFSLIALTICFIVFFKIIYRNSIYSSKTVLKVVNKAEANNVWQFDFKDSKHFVLTDYNLFGLKIYYGIYQKQGDTLKIIESNYNGEVKEFPTTGIIKVDTVFWNSSDTMLIMKE
jgi:lysylphosphatidylglycerol synthetase-like protein (DUF2156 family)